MSNSESSPTPAVQAPQAPQTLSLEQALQLALAHHQQGILQTAEELYEKVLLVAPQQPDALHLLGVTRFQRGRLDDAVGLVARALAINPEASAYHNSMGRILLRLGRRDEALTHLQRALELSPQNPEAYFNLAEAQAAAGQLDEAIANFERTLTLKPVYPEARFALAQAVRTRQGWAAAIPHYQIAAAQAPDSPVALHTLGAAFLMSGHIADAHRIMRQGAERWPEHAPFWVGLGSIGFVQGNHAEATRAYEKALALTPNDIAALDGLVEVRRRTCDWRDDISALEQRLVDRYHADVAAGAAPSMRIFTALYTPFDAADQRAIAAANAAAAKVTMPALHGAPAQAPGRIRVGYLIADVRDHPNAHNTLLLYGLHDRSAFEVFVYSWGIDDNSHYRKKIMADAEHFIELRGLTDQAMAERIAADGVQILVDLMGHTGDNRIGVLARRPAPIQVNYLGFPGTSGADYVDYIIGDRWVTPPEHAAHFSEHIVRLPHSYQCNSHRTVSLGPVPERAALGLPPEGFVYCCFNNAYKIDPRVFGLWMDILRAVPGSVMWLYRNSDQVDQHLRDAAQRHDIDPARLVFAPHLPREQHLQRLQAAELFLDTDRCNAHTTASDALWAGVPLLTVPGGTFASRVAASLLSAAGLSEGILPDWPTYTQTAINLAQPAGRPRLQAWAQHLRDRPASLPVFDTPLLVRHLEAAYSAMHTRWRQGAPTAPIDLPETNPPRSHAPGSTAVSSQQNIVS